MAGTPLAQTGATGSASCVAGKELRSAAMKTAAAIARFVLGLVFVVFGLNGFLNFMPMGPVPALAGQFAGALIQSHYMAVVLTLEILSGVLLLTNSYALLATTFVAPITCSWRQRAFRSPRLSPLSW